MTGAQHSARPRAGTVLRVRSNVPAACLAAVTSVALVGAAAVGFLQNPLDYRASNGLGVSEPGAVRAIELPSSSPSRRPAGAGALSGGTTSGTFGRTGGFGGPGVSGVGGPGSTGGAT